MCADPLPKVLDFAPDAGVMPLPSGIFIRRTYYMKKFLALVLALVMTMSLVTVGASAKTDFTDDAKITNEEAVEVLNAMGVLTGYADGSFRPQATLTRGAGAKIIAYLMLGQDRADKLKATYTVFEDVTDTVGLAQYIEWAAAAGIVDGYGDGNFGPYNQLTEYAFGKMLLTALGYVSAEEGYTGAGWQKNVYGDATAAGIYDGSESWGACDRETAARMALGALKADIVVYGKLANIWLDTDGIMVDLIDRDILNLLNRVGVLVKDGAVESGVPLWRNYKGLTYTAADFDTWLRPGHSWSYTPAKFDNFYMDAPVVAYTEAVDFCDLLVDLDVPVSSDDSISFAYTAYNGVRGGHAAIGHAATHADCNDYFFGGQGVLTQVFENTNPLVEADYIVTEIATYLAKVDDVTKTHAGKSADLTVYYRDLNAFGHNTDDNQVVTSVAEATKTATIATDAYAEDDILMVTYNARTGKIVDHELAIGVAGKLSGYVKDAKAYPEASKTYVDAKANKDAFGFVEQYDASKLTTNVGTSYVFYYDTYGNVLGMLDPAPTAANYGVIDSIWAYDTDLGVHTIKADFVTMDAKTNANVNVSYFKDDKAVDVPETDVDENKLAAQNVAHCNYLATYSIDANGNWTIDDADENIHMSTVAHHKANHVLTSVGGNATTLYLTEKTQILVHDVAGNYTAYTGYAALPLLHAEYAQAMTDDTTGFAEIVYIEGAVMDGSTVKGYITNAEEHGYIEHTDGETYYMFDIYVGGVKTTAYVDATNKAIITAAGMYEMTFKAVDDVVVVDTVKQFGAADGYYPNAKITEVSEGLIEFTTDVYTLAGVPVYLIDDEKNLTVGSVEDLVKGDYVDVYCTETHVTLGAIYVHVVD